MDNIVRKGGEAISRENSDDDPVGENLVITHQQMLENGVERNTKMNKTKVKGNVEEMDKGDKLKIILSSARKRLGLKPMYPEHISPNQIEGDINGQYYRLMRKQDAKDFLINELKAYLKKN